MIELTEEQCRAIDQGEAVYVRDQGRELVLLRGDMYEKLKDEDYDAGPWTDEERDSLRQEALDYLDHGRPQ